MYWWCNRHKDYHCPGQPEAVADRGGLQTSEGSERCLRAGDEEGLKTARANLSAASEEAKRQYSRRIAPSFQRQQRHSEPVAGIQTITDYKPPPQTCDSTIPLLERAECLLCSLEAQNSTTAQKTPPPPGDQVDDSFLGCVTERLCSGTHWCLHRHFQHLTKPGCCPHMLQSYHHHSSPEEVISILLQWLPSSSTHSYSHEVLWTASSATHQVCPPPHHWTPSVLHIGPIARPMMPSPLPSTQALTHLDKMDTYVRLLFIDFSSAFNTIISTAHS